MAYTEAQGRANRKYRNKVYDRLEIYLEKGGKAEVKAVAEATGISVNEWMKRAVKEKMSRDNVSIAQAAQNGGAN